jgi:hypothetical protein
VPIALALALTFFVFASFGWAIGLVLVGALQLLQVFSNFLVSLIALVASSAGACCRCLRIPEQVGHQFRSNPATDSVSFRPGIPVESGH